MAYFMEKVDRAEDAHRFSKEESCQDAPGEGGSKSREAREISTPALERAKTGMMRYADQG